VPRREQDGQITYRPNAESPMFEELRTLVEKSSGIGELVRKALQPAAAQREGFSRAARARTGKSASAGASGKTADAKVRTMRLGPDFHE